MKRSLLFFKLAAVVAFSIVTAGCTHTHTERVVEKDTDTPTVVDTN
jgi:hypothetical protein